MPAAWSLCHCSIRNERALDAFSDVPHSSRLGRELMVSLLPSLVSCGSKLWLWSLAREIGRGCLQVFSKIESGRTLGRGSIVGGKPGAAGRGSGS